MDRSTKPLLLSPSNYNRFALRDIVVPAKLMSKFLILAIRNTEENKETCGILAGVLQQDQLFITHLLIPKQSGTADSCSTENEEEIFSFQDEHDLITLGWIHVNIIKIFDINFFLQKINSGFFSRRIQARLLSFHQLIYIHIVPTN